MSYYVKGKLFFFPVSMHGFHSQFHSKDSWIPSSLPLTLTLCGPGVDFLAASTREVKTFVETSDMVMIVASRYIETGL